MHAMRKHSISTTQMSLSMFIFQIPIRNALRSYVIITGNRSTGGMPRIFSIFSIRLQMYVLSGYIPTAYGIRSYFLPYFFIFRYSVAGLTFSIAAARSRCPRQALSAPMIFSLSSVSSLKGVTAGADVAPAVTGRIPSSGVSISSSGVSASSTARLTRFWSSRTLPGHE